MKRIAYMLMSMMIVRMIMTIPSYAVTYPFPVKEPARFANVDYLETGAKVYLFHSGTKDVKLIINVNDVLTVYREYPPNSSFETRPSGKVKVLSSLGAYYFKGEVIEKEVRSGDVAMKSGAACFVTPITGMRR